MSRLEFQESLEREREGNTCVTKQSTISKQGSRAQELDPKVSDHGKVNRANALGRGTWKAGRCNREKILYSAGPGNHEN